MSMALKYGMMKRAKKMAEGGFVMEEKRSGLPEETIPEDKDNAAADAEDQDMVERIMLKRYSEGGMVANRTPITADFEDNEFDDLVKDDELESSYTGANSGDEIGDEQEDEDRRDIVSRIMRSRAKGDRMPRPA